VLHLILYGLLAIAGRFVFVRLFPVPAVPLVRAEEDERGLLAVPRHRRGPPPRCRPGGEVRDAVRQAWAEREWWQ
jgi:hypothetical protein